MSIPTHDRSCYTKAYQTACPDCKDRVWFFSCSCGSRVFYNELGWPWIKHYCKNYFIREAIELVRNIERFTDSEIFHVIEDYRRKYWLEISDEVWEIIEYELGRRRLPFKIAEVDCNPNIDLLSGKIMQINRNINFYKKFKLDKDSVFSKGLLGRLSDDEYDEVILRTNPDNKNQSLQYKAYLKHKILKRTNLKMGDIVLAVVSVISIPPGKIWEIDDFKIY